MADATVTKSSNKNYLVALTLSAVLGTLALDRFYLRKYGTAILKLITFGGLGIWYIIDVALIGFGKTRAKGSDAPLEGYDQWKDDLRGVLKAFLILQIIGVVLTIAALIILAAVGAFAVDKAEDLTDSTSGQYQQLTQQDINQMLQSE